MHRRYDRELFAGKIRTIRHLLPDAFIGVDVIAGMRGETEACFEDALRFIETLDISRLHVFPYSEGKPVLYCSKTTKSDSISADSQTIISK